MSRAVPVPSGPRGVRPACWFPLLLFGGLAALSLPLPVLASPRPATGIAILTRQIYPTVTQAMASLGLNAWSWLDSLWRLGTFALLAIGVGLAILARAGHSRALGAMTAVYLAAVGLAGWLALQQSSILPLLPYGDPGVGLPAAVLLLSGLGTLQWAGLRGLRR